MRGTWAAVVGAVGLLAATVTPSAAGHGGGATCAEPLPVTEVSRGTTGVGYTVARGRQMETFAVEVLGVLEDALAPGRDVILVDTSGPLIDRVGGTWAGMSGSPVYVGGRLLGAVAFGLTLGPSTVAGVTPAEDLIAVGQLPPVAASGRDRVPLDQATREQIAGREGVSASSVGSDMRPLPLPLSVSGATARTIERLRGAAEAAGSTLLPVAGSAARASQTPAGATLEPGDNLMAALSYGDVTTAGTGVASWVCGDTVVGFGHPMLWSGATTLGANVGDSVTIVRDPTLGNYEVATIAEAVGTVDQDRLAGIRARRGPLPRLVPVTSSVTAVDTGRSRAGRTDVAFERELPFLAFLHGIANVTTVFDAVADGSSEVGFTVSGTRPDGSSWRLQRDNRHSSSFEIAFESVAELLHVLSVIALNPYEEVRFTGVHLAVTVDDEPSELLVHEVLVRGDDGGYQAVGAAPLAVEPGQTLDLRVRLARYRQPDPVQVDLALTVPADAPPASGVLEVRGGRGGAGEDPFLCLFDPAACAAPALADGFAELLAELENAPRNDDLVARLLLFPGGGPPMEEPPTAGPGREEPAPAPAPGEPAAHAAQEPPPPGGVAEPVVVEARTRLDDVVTGEVIVPVEPAGAVGVSRVAGATRIGTAIAVSQASFAPGSVDTVVVAQAGDHADALAAAPLAASLGAPVLLTGRDALHPAVAGEVARLGADRAVVLGGGRALASRVEADLRAAGVATVERLAGADRYDTARLVAARLPGPEAFLVSGERFADAVAVSGLAAHLARPILLTRGGDLPAPTRTALAGRQTVTVVGGGRAVSEAVADAVGAAGVTVARVAGADRYATSLVLAEHAVEAGADPLRTVVASGEAFPDALTAGPFTALRGGVLVLVHPGSLAGSPAAAGWFDRLAGAPAAVTIVGGPAAVSPEVEAEIAARLAGGGEPPPGAPPSGAPASEAAEG